MLPLALTSTLSLVLAVGGGAATTEEHSVAPEPTPTPPKAVTDTPTRPEPKHKGTGLLVATGVFGVTAFSVTVARNAILKKNCPLSDSMPVAACTYEFGSDIGLAATQWVSNIVTVSLAPAAGTVLGRYHAWKDAGTGKQRKAKALMELERTELARTCLEEAYALVVAAELGPRPIRATLPYDLARLELERDRLRTIELLLDAREVCAHADWDCADLMGSIDDALAALTSEPSDGP